MENPTESKQVKTGSLPDLSLSAGKGGFDTGTHESGYSVVEVSMKKLYTADEITLYANLTLTDRPTLGTLQGGQDVEANNIVCTQW